ncbi:hypothetical protein L6164_006072 [Bauhinia variegata]|uniref:Uncharacterized protein n=1 Tax=Bauhinia variegata TaxID=167791 RepID=A0ACB9PTU2_BAUVA|nr:hypothetical protein L6164_006072 [Bauhinia variegata]
MNSIALLGSMLVNKLPYCLNISRTLCDHPFHGDKFENGFGCVEEPLRKIWNCLDRDPTTDEILNAYSDKSHNQKHYSLRQRFLGNIKLDAKRVLQILQQDGPGFDARLALDELHITPSALLLREVLIGILKNINYENKTKCSKLAYKFFVWSSQKETYQHTANSYHLIMKIFAECEEFKQCGS